jgi:hypothetical protein
VRPEPDSLVHHRVTRSLFSLLPRTDAVRFSAREHLPRVGYSRKYVSKRAGADLASMLAGGYGMIAGQPIVKGEKLVNVPRNLWMTSLTAKDSPICGQMVKDHGLDSWKVRHIREGHALFCTATVHIHATGVFSVAGASERFLRIGCARLLVAFQMSRSARYDPRCLLTGLNYPVIALAWVTGGCSPTAKSYSEHNCSRCRPWQSFRAMLHAGVESPLIM